MKTIMLEDMHQLLDNEDDAFVIHVLSRDQYQEAHIPGSYNIPVDDPDFVEQVRRQMSGKDHKIVTYCAGYTCNASTNAAEKLEAAGFTNVYAFEGGMQEWQAANEPVTTGATALDDG